MNPEFIVLMSDGQFYSCQEATSKETAIAEAEKLDDSTAEAVYVLMQ